MGGWVDDRGCSWLWLFDVFRTFVFWTYGGFTTLLDDEALRVGTGHTSTTTAVNHLTYCCITHRGWVDRFVGTTYCCTAVVQGCGWVDGFVRVLLTCVHTGS